MSADRSEMEYTPGREARGSARAWWWARFEEGGEANLRVLTRKAVAELGKDPDFRDRFIDEFLYPVLHDIGQRLLAEYRGKLRTSSGLQAQVEQDLAEPETADRWRKWLQYDPKKGVHVPLLDMTKTQVTAASRYCLDRSGEFAMEARWLKRIARKMTSDQVVSDVMTGDDLDALRHEFTKEKS